MHVSDYILEDRENELIKAIAEASETDPTITVCKPKDFKPGFLDGLKHDGQILDELVGRVGKGEKQIQNSMNFSPACAAKAATNLLAKPFNETGKLVIFSEARDTTLYLTEQLTAAGFGPLLTVDSHNRKAVMPVVRANFDANVPIGDAANRKDDFHILISTEVLAEGVNLHRAHVIVNYDTPWNSTRLMQRIGRVNRIGSTAKAIHIFNFYPTTQVDDDIDLQRKAFLKLQAFHTALGEDSQIYSPDEEVDNFGLFDRAIEEERDERLRFLSELRDFKDANEDDFRRIRNLPLRARCGRQDAAQAGQTLAFIRDDRRDFYRITDKALRKSPSLKSPAPFVPRLPNPPRPCPPRTMTMCWPRWRIFAPTCRRCRARTRRGSHRRAERTKRHPRCSPPRRRCRTFRAKEKALFVAAQHAVRACQNFRTCRAN